jgi:hypothetical protein
LLLETDGNNIMAQDNILDPGRRIVASKRFDGNYLNMYFFYDYDMRGSVTSILKPDGSLVKGYSYDEFGNTIETGETQFKNDTKFTGAVHDTSTGLYYMNARFYNFLVIYNGLNYKKLVTAKSAYYIGLSGSLLKPLCYFY